MATHLVTGAGSGIGAVVARTLLDRGDGLVLLARSEERAEEHLVAPAALTRVALPALRAGRGTVVFVNSGAGLQAHAEWSAYAASKHGLRALADSLRAEEASSGVRVSTVYPGRTATPMQEKVHAQEGRSYDAGDWIRPETVADAIVRIIDLPRDATVSDLTVRPG